MDDLNFRSISPDWMVINSAKGIFTASGTINGSGEHIILVSVIDGNIAGGPDRIHVMICIIYPHRHPGLFTYIAPHYQIWGYSGA